MMSGFSGMRVLSLESRRAEEMGKLISNFGGIPIVAPSMREVPIESNTATLEFASALQRGEIHIVIFLTGVGTRALTKVIETKYPLQDYISALSKVPVIARGPKPVAALREMGVPIGSSLPNPTLGAKSSRYSITIRLHFHSNNVKSPFRSTAKPTPSFPRPYRSAARRCC